MKRPNLDSKTRWEVLKRDNFTCQKCGFRERVPKYRIEKIECSDGNFIRLRHYERRRINVHHKDQNPFNNDMDNLETRCDECHRGKKSHEFINNEEVRKIIKDHERRINELETRLKRR